ncbi:hypothetical protein CPB85DRAFT_111053 [Mucidula mucida]|nr:hypothetical protein CPB85DRAFT_111053 [Mucidula mucida]
MCVLAGTATSSFRYFRAVEIPPSTFTALWLPLSFMLKFMFNDKQRETPQWKTDFSDLYPVLVVGLENAVGPVYEISLQNSCFERIAVEAWHEMWAELVIAYISGLVRARETRTVPGIVSTDLMQYARYIYQPDNLVLACVLVALLPSSGSRYHDKSSHPIRSLRSGPSCMGDLSAASASIYSDNAGDEGRLRGRGCESSGCRGAG